MSIDTGNVNCADRCFVVLISFEVCFVFRVLTRDSRKAWRTHVIARKVLNRKCRAAPHNQRTRGVGRTDTLCI